MTISPDALLEIKKFLKKLTNVIEHQAVFNFMNYKYVNKSRIDDILCCIEANFPKELKENKIKNNSEQNKKLQSIKLYRELLLVVQHKSFFSGSHYAIDYNGASKLIDCFIASFKHDCDYLNSLS